YDAPTFTLMPVGYTPRRSVQVSGFGLFCCLTPTRRLVSASCSSGQRFASGFLQICSHPQHPCLQLTLPPAGCVEDFHLRVGAPCRAHKKKGPTTSVGPLKNGGAMRDRTADLLHAMQALSQLSYRPGVAPRRDSAVAAEMASPRGLEPLLPP